ncbi:ATP-binding cassette domain-containing protein [Comamonas sp. NLF-1-9]|uniref:branched-chain amino acid ABC transporter ATP-binding protein/permease n=1 Tax=Comamonas sp. NLF-1-9 TaxID=2853163 RepID=UPI001C46428B|nr:branched-chain amino acid ABC transporter ATP-binding protein/permease [Comamonas sp. NLF-1-9]QXL83352.1 branched-chain amino acid ABC transporter ATP-binding protein/permease [Comamonas sp. NLF-1-9]
MSSRHWTWLAIALLAIAWPLLSPFTITLLNYIGLYALVAVGLVLLTGVGGITSFGQAAFVGLGAYATAWVCTSPLAAQALSGLSPGLLPWLGLLLGLLVTGVIAWVLGAVTLPLSGHFLALGTLAWGLSLYYLFGNIEGLGGFTGIAGVQPLSIAGLELASPRLMGIVIWAVLLLAIWAMHNLLDSREGRAIRALKSGRVMAESMGVDTSRQRMKLFLLAALLAAISGWLYTHLQRFVNPTPFNLEIGIEYLFMAVVGGSGHLWGAVLGATLITLLKEQLQDWLPKLLGTSGNFEAIVFGLLMILLLQRAADGLWPLITARVGRWVKPAPVRAARTTQAALGRRKLPPLGQVVLRAEQVTKRFAGLVANDAVDLEVKAGEVHALIGPNGAGKSTFFNMISGVDDPSAGQVALLGQPMTGKPARAFAALGMGRTFQHVRLLGQRTVLENVALGAHLRGRRGWLSAMLQTDRHEEAALLAEARKQIERCGLQSYIDTPAASLPLGQQRIVEIARALAGQPSILLLDEPAAGLRHLEKQALVQLLMQLRAEGLAVLVVEHDMEFVMNLADRITVLEFGRVIALGTPDEVQANPRVMQAYLGVEDIEGDAA